MPQHSRRYTNVLERVDLERQYQPDEALDLVKDLSPAKFDETVEFHLRTNVDPRHADQMIRGVVGMPHGLGKTVRVLVFAGAEGAEAARQAGADYVGEDDLIERIEGGWLEFEIGLATPQVMPKIGKLGRILGRRGLMPNPRSGTMVQPQDLPRAIQEAKGGRIEYRTDRTAIIHCALGKVSFETLALVENLATLADAITRDRPAALKGPYFRSAYVTSSMGPSVPLDLAALLAMQPPE